MTAPKRRAEYADLYSVPENMIGEILDGELIASARPAIPHALATSMISAALIAGAGEVPEGVGVPTGWWILYEPELHLDQDVLVPDVAGWRRERLPDLPDVVGVTMVPDWVCEVVSPPTGAIDRGRKLRIYAREGVKNIWLVAPTPRTLEVYRLESGRWVVVATHAGGEVVRAEPFAEVPLEMRRWWRAA